MSIRLDPPKKEAYKHSLDKFQRLKLNSTIIKPIWETRIKYFVSWGASSGDIGSNSSGTGPEVSKRGSSRAKFA